MLVALDSDVVSCGERVVDRDDRVVDKGSLEACSQI